MTIKTKNGEIYLDVLWQDNPRDTEEVNNLKVELSNYSFFPCTVDELYDIIIKNRNHIRKINGQIALDVVFKPEEDWSIEEKEKGIMHKYGASKIKTVTANVIDLKSTLNEIANMFGLINIVIKTIEV